MATAAQRDRQIDAARKRIITATEKRDKMQAVLREQDNVLATQTKRIGWLQSMPVDDEDNTEPAEPEGDDPADDDDAL